MTTKERIVKILDSRSIDTSPDVLEYVAELLVKNGVIFNDTAEADMSLSHLLRVLNDSQELRLVFSKSNFLHVTPGFLKSMGVGTMMDCKIIRIETNDDCSIDVFFRGGTNDC